MPARPPQKKLYAVPGMANNAMIDILKNSAKKVI